MAKVSIYLNFPGNTAEAFQFYKSVFKTEFYSTHDENGRYACTRRHARTFCRRQK